MGMASSLFVIAGLVVLLTSSIGGGALDRRFKTGRKGNIRPTAIPFRSRLLVAVGLWILALAVSFFSVAVYLLVVAAAVPLTWKLFPLFVSRWTRYRNSEAQLFAGRLIACILFGVYVPYLFLNPLGDAEKSSKLLITSNVPVRTLPPRAENPQIASPIARTIGQQTADLTTVASHSTESAAQPGPINNEPQRSATSIQSSISPNQASQPSFDCRGAANFSELTICDSPLLSALDFALAGVYAARLSKASDTEQLRIAQRLWLRNQRDVCDTAACLQSAYEARLSALRAH